MGAPDRELDGAGAPLKCVVSTWKISCSTVAKRCGHSVQRSGQVEAEGASAATVGAGVGLAGTVWDSSTAASSCISCSDSRSPAAARAIKEEISDPGSTAADALRSMGAGVREGVDVAVVVGTERGGVGAAESAGDGFAGAGAGAGAGAARIPSCSMMPVHPWSRSKRCLSHTNVQSRAAQSLAGVEGALS